MTKEPPKGLRANLRSTYSKMDDDKLKRTCKPADFRKMLFGEGARPSHRICVASGCTCGVDVERTSAYTQASTC